MRFDEYIRNGKVRKTVALQEIIQGLIINAKNHFNICKRIQLDDNTASFCLKNYYDCIRMLLDANLAKNGYKSYSHEAVIIFAEEKKIITPEVAKEINNIRIMRHDIIYRGDIASLLDSINAIKIFEKLIAKIV